MTIDLPASSFSETLLTLARGLSAPLDVWDGGNVITLSPPLGRGAITVVRFYHGLSLLHWQVDLEEEVMMYVAATDHHPLRLMLCTQGSVYHSIDAHRIRYPLASLESSLSVGSGDVDQHFCLPAHQSLNLYMVEIDRAIYESRVHFPPGDGHHSLAAVFFDAFAPTPFLYRSPYCQLTIESLRDLEDANQYQGLARHTFMEAKTLELLSLALQQYVEHQHPPDDWIFLSEADIKLLEQARRYVMEHYVDLPTVQEISQIVGVDEVALQKGYQQLFRVTIRQQGSAEKLYRARELMREGKEGLEEIVHRVGYGDPGRFVTHFRERYGMSPKEYQQMIRNNSP